MERKIKGIKSTCSQTKGLRWNYGFPLYIMYNLSTSEVWGVELGHVPASDNPHVICCGRLHVPASMETIKRVVKAGIARQEHPERGYIYW